MTALHGGRAGLLRARVVMLTALVGAIVAGAACTERAADATKAGTAKAIDSVQKASEATADKTKEVAGDIAAGTKVAVTETGEVISDAWITTKVNALFVDEALLKDSRIDVDTADRVVTLKGTVRSAAGKDRAGVVAGRTGGVVRVVNQLVVK